MNHRTLVKISAGENCIGFKTISRQRSSEREFLVTRDELALLKDKPEIITRDIHSFAILRRDFAAGTLRVDFSWLCGGCNYKISGWEESVTLPYDALAAFVEASAREGGPKNWSALSICQTTRPKLVFHAKKRLRECLADRTVRKKLSHALRDNFHYPNVDEIDFYHDFAPYSFLFREVRNGQADAVGGLIFHNYNNDLKKAYYSVHT